MDSSSRNASSFDFEGYSFTSNELVSNWGNDSFTSSVLSMDDLMDVTTDHPTQTLKPLWVLGNHSTAGVEAKPGSVLAKQIGLAVMAGLIVVSNGMLIFILSYHKRLRTITNSFIISLAAVDFLGGVITIPLHLVVETHDLREGTGMLCLAVMSMTSFTIVGSVLTLLSVTIERYLAIVYPLKHRKWAHHGRINTIICLTWMYSILFGSLPLMGVNALHYHKETNVTSTGQIHRAANSSEPTRFRCQFGAVLTGQYIGILFCVHVGTLSIALPFLYIHSFIKVRKFIERKGSSACYTDDEKRAIKISRSHRKSLRLLIIMILYFLLSWIPMCVWYSVTTKGFTQTYFNFDVLIQDNQTLLALYQVSVLVAVANSVISPYLYGLGNIKTRTMFKRTIRSWGRWIHARCTSQPTEPYPDQSLPLDRSFISVTGTGLIMEERM